jgi:F-type H+-transporting ATPase subunit alpha
MEVILSITNGVFDNVPVDRIAEAQEKVIQALAPYETDLQKKLKTIKKLSDQDKKDIINKALNAVVSLKGER